MKRLSMILLGVLTLPAYGGIASVEYTNAQISEVSKAIEAKADKSGYTPNMLLQTKDDGTLTATTLKTNMIENGAVTNSKLASNIGLDKLNMGTLPASGKHILIWNSADSKYVFEELIKPVIKPAAGLQCPTGQYDIGFAQCIDPNIPGDHYGYDSSTMTWTVTFSYGTINGIASCNSTPGDHASFTWSSDSSNWSRSGDTFNQSSEGQYCWCKTTSPAASRWVFYYDLSSSAGTCSGDCANLCAVRVQDNSDFRSGVFSVVGK